MRTSKHIRRAAVALALPLALASVGSVRAAEPTQAEADRIRAAVEEYIGTPAPGAPRIFDVRPKGDAYEWDIAFDTLLTPLVTQAGATLKTGHATGRLVQQPDGTWRQTIETFPGFVVTHGPETTEVAYQGLSGEGVFDPAKGYFVSSTTRAARLSATSTHVGDDKKPGVTARVAEENFATDMTAGPAASGRGVDVVGSMKASKFLEQIETTATPGTPAVTISVSATERSADVRITSLRDPEVRDLWKWIVAKGGFAGTKTDPEGLKKRLLALGDLFDRLSFDGKAEDIGVETPFGIGGAKHVGSTFEAAGLGPDGRAAFSVDVAGLKVASVLLPAWSQKLMPTDVTLRGSAAGWRLGEALAVLLAITEPGNQRPLTPEEQARLRAAVLPTGKVVFDLAGTHLRGAKYDLTLDGTITVENDKPKGELVIRSTGLDEVMRDLGDVRGDPNVQQVLIGLGVAAGAATRDGAAHVWRMSIDGEELSVNGMPIGGKPKPTPAPDGAAPAPTPAPNAVAPTTPAPNAAAPAPNGAKSSIPKPSKSFMDGAAGKAGKSRPADEEDDDDTDTKGSSTKGGTKK